MIPFLVRHQRMAPPLPLDKLDSAVLVQSALVGGGSAGLPEYASSLSHGSGIRAGSVHSGTHRTLILDACSNLATAFVRQQREFTSVCSGGIVDSPAGHLIGPCHIWTLTADSDLCRCKLQAVA